MLAAQRTVAAITKKYTHLSLKNRTPELYDPFGHVFPSEAMGGVMWGTVASKVHAPTKSFIKGR